jgi:hypothetical protein
MFVATVGWPLKMATRAARIARIAAKPFVETLSTSCVEVFVLFHVAVWFVVLFQLPALFHVLLLFVVPVLVRVLVLFVALFQVLELPDVLPVVFVLFDVLVLLVVFVLFDVLVLLVVLAVPDVVALLDVFALFDVFAESPAAMAHEYTASVSATAKAATTFMFYLFLLFNRVQRIANDTIRPRHFSTRGIYVTMENVRRQRRLFRPCQCDPKGKM